MTTIAVGKESIAWDSQETFGHLRAASATEKVILLGGRIYAAAGDSEMCEFVPGWHAEGANVDNLPGEREWEMVVVHPEKNDGEHVMWYYSSASPMGYPIKAPFALGSGNKIAWAYMLIGKTPLEAVQLTSKLDVYTGEPFKGLNYADVFCVRPKKANPKKTKLKKTEPKKNKTKKART